jgi:hypothetical protein
MLTKEGFRVPIDDGHVGIVCGNGSKIDGKHRLDERSRFHIGMKFYEVG